MHPRDDVLSAPMRAMSCAAAAVLFSACWSAPRPAAPRQDLPIALTVEQAELANGLKVVVVPEPSVGEVSVTIRYAVGSADDPEDRAGLAHLVEHLLFENVRDGEALFDALERRALAFNGFTLPDATIYTERGMLGQLEELLALETARLVGTCTAIPEAAFVRQREIVRNELRERAVDDDVQAALNTALFAAPRKTATAETIDAITQDEACSFAARHYAASNAVVVVSGAVQLAEIRPLLERTLGRAPRIAPAPPRSVPASAGPRTLAFDAPVDRTWFVLAWPMPADLPGRTRLRAVATMATGLVQGHVNGIVTRLELGSGASRFIAIAVAPSGDISARDALDTTKNALSRIGPWFGSGLYEHAKNRAICDFAASLDHGGQRDFTLAYEAATAGDVHASLDKALHDLTTMDRDDANRLAHSGLDPDQATLVTLRPAVRTAGVAAASLAPSFHEERRRKLEDPAEARRPLDRPAPGASLARVRMHTLDNGLNVVLLPLATMPTVDIRFVLPVGTADEPPGQRGVALVAAHALDAPFDTTMFQFLQNGGRLEPDVDFDQTVFSTRGMASRLDVLLAGIATTLREGTYDLDGVRDAANWLTMTSSQDAEDRVASSAWRDALYGAGHPYRFASQWQHVERKALGIAALERFRRQHYQPSGATLIVAGNFEPASADRWIEYHFADWSGAPIARTSPRAVPRALAFAQPSRVAQVSLVAAFALPGDDAVAEQLVTEMVREAIADVREQLAASYGLSAVLIRRRLSTRLELTGTIDAARAGDALAMLRDRLDQLRAGGDSAASLFVSARRHVVGQLLSVDTRAEALADRVVQALDSGTEPRFNFADAERARTMTLDKVSGLLERIDLSSAAMLVRGPEAATTAAYAAIGRTPALLR